MGDSVLAMREGFLCLVLLTGFTFEVRADVLGPPPTDCVAGAVGRTARVGEWCEPSVCGEGAPPCPSEPFCPTHGWPCSAPEPWSCSEQSVALCVRHETRTEYRRPGMEGPARTHEVDVALGPCGEADACPDGSTCERARRCLHAAADSVDEPDSPAEAAEETSPEARPESDPEEASPAPTCSCRASPSGGPAWGWLLGCIWFMGRRSR